MASGAISESLQPPTPRLDESRRRVSDESLQPRALASRTAAVARLEAASLPAHKFTRTNDFSGLAAPLRNFLTARRDAIYKGGESARREPRNGAPSSGAARAIPMG